MNATLRICGALLALYCCLSLARAAENPILAQKPVLWLRADQGVQLDNGKVTLWRDQSGQGHDAVRATGAAPTVQEKGIGGKPSLVFTGGALQVGLLNLEQMTVYVVAQKSTTFFQGRGEATVLSNRVGVNDSGLEMAVRKDGRLKTFMFNGRGAGMPQLFATTPKKLEQPFIGAYINGKTFAELLVNGGNPQVYNEPFVPSPQQPLLIGDRTPESGNCAFDGQLAEIILFDRALSADERKVIDTELSARYNIPLVQPKTALPPITLTAAEEQQMATIKKLDAALWLRADQGVQLDNGKVTRWVDQSGKEHDATLAAGPAPTVVSDGIGGKRALEFTGGSLQVNLLDVGKMTLFVVAQKSETFFQGRGESTIISNRVGHNATGFEMCVRNDGKAKMFVFNGRGFGMPQLFATVPEQLDTPYLTTLVNGKNFVEMRINGGDKKTYGEPFAASTQQPLIIGDRSGESGNCAFDGLLSEVLLFDRVLTYGERRKIEEYLAARYQLPLEAVDPEGDGQQEADGAYMNTFTHTLITPHRPYASPAGWAAPRVLFLTPHNVATREVAEMLQRLDMTVDVVSTYTESALEAQDPWTKRVAGWNDGEKTAEVLDKLKKPHDVIVLGNFSYAALPAPVQEEIEKQVRAGCGLVLAYKLSMPTELKAELRQNPEPTDRGWIWGGVPVADLPYLNGAWETPPTRRQLETDRLGKGRVVILDYGTTTSTMYGGPSLTPPMAYHPALPTQYHYLLSLPTRALLWAAGRVSETQLDLTSPVTLPDAPATITLPITAATAGEAEVTLRVEDEYGRYPLMLRKTVTLQRGRNTVEFATPRLACSRYYAGAQLLMNGKVVDWGAFAIHAGTPVVANCALYTRNIAPGDTVKGTVTLQRPLAGKEHGEIWLKDAWDRAVAVAPLDVAGTTAVFSIKAPAVNSDLLCAEVVLYDGETRRESYQRDDLYYSLHRPPHKYHFQLWGGNDAGMLGYWANAQFRALGVDCVLDPPDRVRDRQHGALNLQSVPMNYGLGCYNSEEESKYRTRWTGQGFPLEAWPQAEDKARYESEWDNFLHSFATEDGTQAMAYNLGDEIKLGARNIGFTDWWLPPFREHLKTMYGTIERLNLEWGTKYTTFDEVTPRRAEEVTTAQQVAEKAALAGDHSWKEPVDGKGGNLGTYAPYLDHRQFVEAQFGDLLATLQRHVSAVDPAAGLGFEGSGGIEPYYGISIPTVAKSAGFWVPYRARTTNELIRACKNDRLNYGNWFGGYVGERMAEPGLSRYMLWDQLLSGANTPSYYTVSGAEGGLNLDLSYAPHMLVKDFSLLHDGLGEWLCNANIAEDAIAIHFSEASNQVLSFEYPWGYYLNVQEAWLHLLYSQGFQPHYLDSARVERGELNGGKYRVLILPNSVALSEKEVQEIRAFAQAGGTVIADVRPGVLSEHGRYLDKGQLDDLFGITRTSTLAKMVLCEVKGADAAGTVALDLSKTDVDPTAHGKGAITLADGTPLLIEQTTGKGHVLLLNFNVYPANPENHDGRFIASPPKKRSVGLEALLLGMMRKAGVAPSVQVTAAKTAVPQTRRTWFVDGETKVLCVLRTPEKTVRTDGTNATIALDKAGWVYDVVAGKPLGQIASITTNVNPADMRVYAILPAKAQPPTLMLPASVKCGATLPITLTLPGRNRALVRLDITGPDGQPCAWATQLVWTSAGKASIVMPVAKNEIPGRYTLKVTDVLTNLSATQVCQVQ